MTGPRPELSPLTLSLLGGHGFLDTLEHLSGGGVPVQSRPKTGVYGEYNDSSSMQPGWDPYGVSLSPLELKPAREFPYELPPTMEPRASADLRSTAAHEFGHLLSLKNAPELLQAFDRLRNSHEQRTAMDYRNDRRVAEAFADMFAEAASRHLPNVRSPMKTHWSYDYTPQFLNEDRMRLLEDYIVDRMKTVGRTELQSAVHDSSRNAAIMSAAREYKVPLRLALAVSRVENGPGNPTARGKAGEVGIFQVMADMHGASATELEDPTRNAEVALGLLRSHYDRLGSWEKALRAYNGALDKPAAGDAYVNKVRAQLASLAGIPAPSPISSAAREWLDRLAMARHTEADPRFTASEKAQTLRRFHAAP